MNQHLLYLLLLNEYVLFVLRNLVDNKLLWPHQYFWSWNKNQSGAINRTLKGSELRNGILIKSKKWNRYQEIESGDKICFLNQFHMWKKPNKIKFDTVKYNSLILEILSHTLK